MQKLIKEIINIDTRKLNYGEAKKEVFFNKTLSYVRENHYDTLLFKLMIFSYVATASDFVENTSHSFFSKNKTEFSNKIVFTQPYSFYGLQNYRTFKLFTTKPTTICSAADRISYARFCDGLYLFLPTNTLIVDINNLEEELSFGNIKDLNNTFAYVLYIFKHRMDDENKIKLTEFIKNINEIPDFKIINILQTIKSTLDKAVNELQYTRLKISYTDLLNRVLDNKLVSTKKDREIVIQKLYKLSAQLEELENKKKNAPEKSEFLAKTLKKLKSENKLNLFYIEYGVLHLETNYLPIMFYEQEQLERIISTNQLDLNNERLAALKEVSDMNAQLIVLPHTIKIDLTDSTLSTKFSTTYASSCINQHAEFHNGRGCLGSFDAPIEVLKSEANVPGLITIYFQFLQTITIHDPLGNSMLRNLPIINNNNFIINWPNNRRLIGCKIEDILKHKLYDCTEEQIKKFKEEHYGNQSNE